LYLPPTSKLSTKKKALKTSLKDARAVERKESNKLEAALQEKCIRLFALIAEQKPLFHLSQLATNQFIVKNAIKNKADKYSFIKTNVVALLNTIKT
jgi:hypothetical protein